MIVAFFTAAANALASSMSISPASFRRAFNSSPPNVALVALGEAVDEFGLGGEERSLRPVLLASFSITQIGILIKLR